MPTECNASQLEFEGFARRRVIADFQGGPMTSDAGTLLLRHTDRAIGLIDRVAACFVDYRMPELVEHQLPSMVGQRIAGVALGYEDVMGHAKLDSTAIYTQVATNTIRSVVSPLDRLTPITVRKPKPPV